MSNDVWTNEQRAATQLNSMIIMLMMKIINVAADDDNDGDEISF